MTLEQARKALKRAESIIETSYALTNEVKLLPIALEQAQRAMMLTWKCSGKEKKPKVLEDMEKLLEERKKSPVEFQRKQKLVLWKQNKKITIIEEKTVRDYIQKTKVYLEKTQNA